MVGTERSGKEAVPSKCSVLISSLESKMKKFGLCLLKVHGLVGYITCQQANMIQYNHRFSGGACSWGLERKEYLILLEESGKTSQTRKHVG